MALRPTFHDPIPMESKVKFHEDAGLGSIGGRTGTVIGIASEYLYCIYVVLLDGPPYERDGEKMRAICMTGTLLTVLKLGNSGCQRNDWCKKYLGHGDGCSNEG